MRKFLEMILYCIIQRQVPFHLTRPVARASHHPHHILYWCRTL